MASEHSTDTSTNGKVLGKPEKPSPDYPLFPHATKRWAKKILGRTHYFGPWDNPEAALEKYLAQKDDLHAGVKPDTSGQASPPRKVRVPEKKTIRILCNDFLNHKRESKESGRITPRSFLDYQLLTNEVIAFFGKERVLADIGPADFARFQTKLSKRLRSVSLGNMIQKVRGLFKFGLDMDLIEKAMKFGPGFERPSKKVLRLEKARKGKKLFTANEIRLMLGSWNLWRNGDEKKLLDVAAESPGDGWELARAIEAGPALKAMLLLAINAGYGNSDVGTLPRDAVDLEGGWVTYFRPKTGIARRAPLWPETVEALRAALAKRPEPRTDEAADLFFLTKYGVSWSKDGMDNPVSKETAKLLKALGINGGRNFYTLRHCFQTYGDEAKDPIATRFLMGHADSSMSAVYRENVSDERLRGVTDHIRSWLFDADE